MNHLNDTKTPEMVNQLRQYWQDLAEVQQHQPDFGRYEPDLLYSESPWEAPKQPDPFYYQAQGEEPPQNGQESDLERLHASIRADGGGRWSFKTVVCCTLFWVAVGEIVLLIWGY
jgi:hypothetical protein